MRARSCALRARRPPWLRPRRPHLSLSGRLERLCGQSTELPQIFGRRTALLAGLSASLGLFLIGAGAVIATGGGPYTPGQISEAGATNVTTYVVSAGLGNGVILMLLIPLTTAMIGWAGAALTAYLRRA